jgi:uncharacterized membrane protein
MATLGTVRPRIRRFITHNLHGELWLIPAGFVVVALALGPIVTQLQQELDPNEHLPFMWRGTAASGESVASTVATSVLSLAALVFSISMVVLQLTSQQFSPRALRTFNRDPRTQMVLGVFVATFLFSLLAAGSLGGSTDDGVEDRLSITVVLALAVLSVAAFIFLVHHISQSIRVANIIEAIASETRRCITLNFPPSRGGPPAPAGPPDTPPDSVLHFDRRSGVMTTVWFEELAELARQHDCVLRLVPEVGEYVPRGAVLCEVWGEAPPLRKVLRLTEIESERTVEIDVGFGIRQLVDIGEKALSPAVNDPTTAVQCLDRLTDLVDRLGRAEFPRGAVPDREGTARIHYEPLTWEATVDLAFDELRDYGAPARQVARRLRATLLRLQRDLPPDRQPALDRQIELLDRALRHHFPDPDDLAEYLVADDLGIGGER